MAIEVKARFLNTEDYLITAEITMNAAQWKLLFLNIKDHWREPMASFVEPLKKTVENLEQLVVCSQDVDKLNQATW